MAVSTPGAGGAAGEPVEVSRLLELTAGDKAFALQIVEPSPKAVPAHGRDAHCTGQRRQVAAAASRPPAEGASANVHAARLRDIAASIENRSGNAAEADLEELLAKLENELDRVSSFLRRELG